MPNGQGGRANFGVATWARTGLRQLGVWRLLLTIVFLAGAVLIARYGWKLPLAIEAERALYDWRQVLTAEKVDQDDRIVMVVYTDERWPRLANVLRWTGPSWQRLSPGSTASGPRRLASIS